MTSSSTAPNRKVRADDKRGNKKGDPSPRQAHNDKFHNFKDCRTCGVHKRLADFHFTSNWRKKRAADPKRYKLDCKDCSKAPDASKVDPNFKPIRKREPGAQPRTEAERRERDNRYKRLSRRVTRIKALEYLASKGCAECGNRDPRVLEFDHIDPGKKSGNVARIFSDGYSWGSERLRQEIRKCRVICANCHRKHTITQQDHYGHADVRAALRKIYEDHNIKE